MENKQLVIIIAGILLLSANLVSALSVDADFITVYPGESGEIGIDVENNNNFDAEDVSLSLILDESPFTAIGSSENSEDEIDEDDSERFNFEIRPSTDIVPGDYNIKYKLRYDKEGNETIKEGSFGIRVSSRTDLDFAIETEDNIVGERGRIDLEIINKGKGEIKSVTVELSPQGYEVLSAERVFLGNIEGEDSDFIGFDVIFRTKSPQLIAKVEYKDFENNEEVKTFSSPIKVYSEEEAYELGLKNKNNSYIYIIGVIALIIVIIVWRTVRKRKNKRRK